MTSSPIRFGTDGWRGVIADDFTFDNVRVAAQATADYLHSVRSGELGVFIGYDVRFLSPQFARATAEVFTGNGFRVLLMDRPYPTPYVSFEVHRRNLAGGVVITASHNTPDFNGFKVKAPFGGSATPAITAEIEALLGRNPVQSSREGIEKVGPTPDYPAHLRTLVDWERISESGLRVVVDSMHGSGGRLLEDLLSETRCEVRTIRGGADPLFGGIRPEPMMPQLEPLREAVLDSGSAVGLATDGDADRLGIIDETGAFVSTLQVLPLLLLHLYRNRGWRGAVAHTFSQSRLVGRIATALDLEVFETPVGFKHIAGLMLEREILLGGEESGGVGFSRHLPERDGLLVNLLMLDLLAWEGKPLSVLLGDMWAEFGEYHYDRRDLYLPVESGTELIHFLENDTPEVFAGKPVSEIRTLDGVKLMLGLDSWILFRRSGTERVLRVYCEAPSRASVREILKVGVRFVEQFAPDGVS